MKIGRKQLIHIIDTALAVIVCWAIWETTHSLAVPRITGIASYCVILRFVFVWRYWICASCRKNLGLFSINENYCKCCGAPVKKG